MSDAFITHNLDAAADFFNRMSHPALIAKGVQATLPLARRDVQLNFREQRSASGVPWKKSIRAKMEGGQTLKNTGTHLYGAITQYVKDDTTVALIIAQAWAWVHHYGATIKAKSAPYLLFCISYRQQVGTKGKTKKAGMWARVKSVIIPKRPFMEVRTKTAEDMARRYVQVRFDVGNRTA